MSYLAFGGNSGTTPPAAALAATGLSVFPGMTAVEAVWLIATVIVIGGTLITFAKLGPRVALDSVRMPASGKYRPWLTFNGRPIGRRFRR